VRGDFDEFTSEVAALPGWYRDALCVEYPHVEFFPARGHSAPRRGVR
jgi:hypothetical protein